MCVGLQMVRLICQAPKCPYKTNYWKLVEVVTSRQQTPPAGLVSIGMSW